MKAEEIRGWLARQRWGAQLALVVTLAIGILLGTLVSNGVRAARDNSGPSAAPLAIPSPVELSSVFAKVAKQVEPAVVNISTVATVGPGQRRGQPREPEDFFERFFDFGQPRPRRERSLGSGVLVDPSGYILTNHHVVAQADKITVRLHGDSKEYPARVIGHDEETDLAVIKIDANRKFPVAELGNSDAVEVGDWVLAIGSPFGLDATVTAGIISYKGREVSGAQQFQRFLQTDAAINRGNSGGPLVNLAGQVIAINTMIATDNGANAGIGFALPSNIAISVYNSITKHGRMVRGSIGVQFTRDSIENEAILRSFGTDHGVVISEVRPNGPAERAGLKRGDVIVAVNGKSIHKGEELVDIVAGTPVGEEVRIRYLRARKEQEAAVRVEDRCQIFPELCGEESAAAGGEEGSTQLGLRVEEATPALLERWGLDRDADQGLLVSEVEPNLFAEEVGLQRGDLILEINQERIRTLSDFKAVQRNLRSGSDVVFGIKRRMQNRATPANWSWLYLGGTLP